MAVDQSSKSNKVLGGQKEKGSGISSRRRGVP